MIGGCERVNPRMKTRSAQYLILLSASLCMTLHAQQKPTTQPFDMASAFPAKMQSFPLHGDAAIPNSKPGPDEETGTNTPWVQKVSRPMIEVCLPAKVKATGAGVLIFPGGARAAVECGSVAHWRHRIFGGRHVASTVHPVISMGSRITHMDSRKALLGTNPSDDLVRMFSNELEVTADTAPAKMH
jgi:hypothetical protein